jgi:hypothetical protein
MYRQDMLGLLGLIDLAEALCVSQWTRAPGQVRQPCILQEEVS